jgi:hypothetical protein
MESIGGKQRVLAARKFPQEIAGFKHLDAQDMATGAS